MMSRMLVFAAILAAGTCLGPSTGFSASEPKLPHEGSKSSSVEKSPVSGETAVSNGSREVKLSGSEKKFLQDAYSDSLAEVRLGQLAKEKASSDQVKQLGDHLISDHQKVADNAKDISSRLGVDLPKDLNSTQKGLVDKLSKLSGAEFDRTFLRENAQGHVKDIRKFEDISKSAKNDDVRNFASSTLPGLQNHLNMIRDSASAAGVALDNIKGDFMPTGKFEKSKSSTINNSERSTDKSVNPSSKSTRPEQNESGKSGSAM